MESMLKYKKWWIGAAAVYCGFVYVGFRPPERIPQHSETDPAENGSSKGAITDRQPTKCEREKIFDDIATIYDDKVGNERWLGILKLRRRLIDKANGRVLEVGGGTGKNLPFYSDKCTELVIADASPRMLKVAASKCKVLNAQKKMSLPKESQVHFIVMDSEKIVFPDNSFDTVIDTFGLCSYDNPVVALQEMNRVCKPEGSILLLEHGASSWSLVTYYLQKLAFKRVWNWGCNWDRDLVKLINDSGLNLSEHKTSHLGTTHTFIIKKEK